jgi:hypothetical protein
MDRKLADSFSRAVKVVLWIVVIAGIALIVWTRFDRLVDNLVAEFIGAILTVYAIDRIIRTREERKLLPAKCLLYARLLEIVDELLTIILPLESYEVNRGIYKYKRGEIYAIPIIQPIDAESLSRSALLVGQDIETRGPSIIASLALAQKQVDAILDSSTFLLDFDLINLLARLSFMFLSSIPEVDWAEEGSRREFIRWLGNVILVIVEIRTWLEHEIDRHFTIVDKVPE